MRSSIGGQTGCDSWRHQNRGCLRALENELARIESEKTLEERVRPIQDRIANRPATGLEADKAFFDELSGES